MYGDRQITERQMNDYLKTPHNDDRLDVSDILRARHDLSYTAPDGSLRGFDLYYPPGSGPFPLIVNISGGGWYYGRPTSVHLGRTLHCAVTRGYAFASLACTSSRDRKFPYQIAEAKCAIRYLRSHASALDLDAGFIANWSASSGGHLALMAALTANDPYFDCDNDGTDCSVDAAAAIYPCIRLDATEEDFTRIGLSPLNIRSGPNCMESVFLGVPVEEAPRLCREASPLSHIRPDAPPLMLMHGTHDRVIPYTFTEEFAERYRTVTGRDAKLVIIPGAGHSDPVFKDEKASATVLDFFDSVRKVKVKKPEQ